MSNLVKTFWSAIGVLVAMALFVAVFQSDVIVLGASALSSPPECPAGTHVVGHAKDDPNVPICAPDASQNTSDPGTTAPSLDFENLPDVGGGK